ncbi:MAG TPA: hypothetical protein EYP74_00705 [Anaerolineales bacterium]|nr:hypothetical protein [Anaerolineales bacterium]
MSLKSLDFLNTWVKTKDLALCGYRELVPLSPPEEKWSVAQQNRLSTNSLLANVAENASKIPHPNEELLTPNTPIFP